MIEIKDLLLNPQYKLFQEQVKKESIIKVIRDVIGVVIKTNEIKIQNGTVFLNIKPIYKSEVLLKKQEISFKIKEYLGKTAPKDFR